MSKDRQLLSSSLGKKLIMSLTGLFLCIFLVVHLIGNLQLFNMDQGKSYNEYSYTMTNFAPIKIVSYLLYASIVIHAIYALVLTIKNRKARPIAYASFKGSANSSWSSRNMGILGTILLVFLVTHMSNFWYKYHFGDLPYIEYRTDLATGSTSIREMPASDFNAFVSYIEHGEEVVQAKDLYKQVAFSFQSWYLVLLYVLAMVALSFHLIHGFQSAFQTLGWDHRRYFPLIKFLGVWVFGVAIPAGFAAMPLYFFFSH